MASMSDLECEGDRIKSGYTSSGWSGSRSSNGWGSGWGNGWGNGWGSGWGNGWGNGWGSGYGAGYGTGYGGGEGGPYQGGPYQGGAYLNGGYVKNSGFVGNIGSVFDGSNTFGGAYPGQGFGSDTMRDGKTQGKFKMSNAYCCVPCCNSWKKKNSELSFFKFPNDASKIKRQNKFKKCELLDRRKVWIRNLSIGKKVSPYMKVCSLHFAEEAFIKGMTRTNRRILKKTAVPTQHLPLLKVEDANLSNKRYLRKIRKENAEVDTPCEDIDTSDNCAFRSQDIEAADALLLLLNSNKEPSVVKTFRDFEVQVNSPQQLTMCHFITDDVTLCNLTVNLCRTYIIDMIMLLSGVLKSAIVFPPMAEIKGNMPHCFKNFEDTQIVLDCTEIFIQTPKCLCCRIRFYSHYKHAQTVKFMTGISPAGLITFVSEAYGGRASDKIIFENSN
ncbi:thap domain protein [Holotrichia oblita]|uniref:Thap domain protein n=1 Tax=Holotrichia oblita TaxID=644536 RepID=A0ACB9TEA9_HOLOL|nr:thap domain protein [Holotrichia oblita]